MNNLDELDKACIACGALETTEYMSGMTWCNEHSYRGELLTWGKVHGWPALESEPFTIVLCDEEIVVTSKIEGQQQWMLHAAFGTEACVLALLVVALSKEMEVAS